VLVRERLYTIRQLAELWFREDWKQLTSSLRRWFEKEPGVINAGMKRNRHLLGGFEERLIQPVLMFGSVEMTVSIQTRRILTLSPAWFSNLRPLFSTGRAPSNF